MPSLSDAPATAPHLPRGILRDRAELVSLGLVGLLSAIVLVWFQREPVYSDDLGYWERWDTIGNARSQANLYRFVVIVSAQLARLAFGESMTAYSAVGIGYGIGLTVALYVLTRLLFPRPVAVGAAVLLLCHRVFLEDATLLLPDWPSMFWFVAGMALLVHAATRLERPRSPTGWALAAGVCFFLTTLTRESSVLILFAVPLALLAITDVRRTVRLTLVAAVSTVGFAVMELGLLWVLYGNPLQRLDIILGRHVSRRTSAAIGGRVTAGSDDSVSRNSDGSEFAWGDLAERYLEPIGATSSGTLFIWFTVAAMLVAVLTWSRPLRFFLALAAVGVGTTFFLVGSIDPITPLLSMKFRYLSLGWTFIPPLIAGGAWMVSVALTNVVARRRDKDPDATRRPAIILFAVILAAPVTFGFVDATRLPLYVRGGSDGLHQTADAVDGLQSQGVAIERIVTDGRTRQGLHIMLAAEDKPLLERSTSDFTAARAGDLVVVNRNRLGRSTSPGRGDTLGEQLLVPPPTWRQIGDASHSDMFIYHVAADPPETPASLSTGGVDLTDLVRGQQLDGEGADFSAQTERGGMFVWMQDVDNAHFVLGAGWHAYPPRDDDPGRDRLTITQSGRLGVRVEMHRDRAVELRSLWLRTYGPDGQPHQEVRLYEVDEDQRTSTPAFAVDTGSLESVSFAASTRVDPSVDATFRVVGFYAGSGVFTVDRVASSLVRLVEPQ